MDTKWLECVRVAAEQLQEMSEDLECLGVVDVDPCEPFPVPLDDAVVRALAVARTHTETACLWVRQAGDLAELGKGVTDDPAV